MPRLKRSVALLLSVCVIFLGSVWLILNYGDTEYQREQLSRLQQQLELQKTENKELEDELARLADPAYARQVEKSKYSISSPKAGEYVFVLPNEEGSE